MDRGHIRANYGHNHWDWFCHREWLRENYRGVGAGAEVGVGLGVGMNDGAQGILHFRSLAVDFIALVVVSP